MIMIKFKAKLKIVYNMDDTVNRQYFTIPKIKRTHCNMDAMRNHPKYSGYANSNMFEAVINKAVKESVGDIINIANVPDNVKIESPGRLLAEITISL